MNHTKVNFHNNQGEELVGYLELPLNQEPHNFVLFAHCFTCNKNFFATKYISKSLAMEGFGVLRFDFTGLGESEGDFSDTNFSGNVEDLLAAAEYLNKQHKAPSLIIGHSLGGAAAILAASQLPSVKAVATVAAPASPKHVTHLLKSELDEIRENGLAVVNLGGRDFTIKEQFLLDLDKKEPKAVVNQLGRALLVLHSPQDLTVSIDNAEEIYDAARHPKSFVSLDGADHMLSDKKDALYAGKVIAAWAKRYIDIPVEDQPETDHQVVANLDNDGFTTEMKVGNHFLIADEPEKMGGRDFGPTPYEYLAAGLAACTSMTLQMYARRKKWDLKNVETHVNYARKHAEDCLACDKESAKIDTFEREIVLRGNLDEKQKNRLLEIADKCPVHRTLEASSHIRTQLSQKEVPG